MTRRLVIFGTGQVAELAWYYFSHDTDFQVAGFTVDREFLVDEQFAALPVVPFDDVTTFFPPASHALFVAMSYSGRNRVRAERYHAALAKGYELPSYVSSKATVWPGFEHGRNCFVLEDNTIQPFACLGNNVTLWSGNHVGHHCRIDDDVFVISHVVISGNAVIGRGSFVGVNVTIRDGVHIGEDSVIGAGALILKDTEDDGVYGPRETERSRVPSSRLRKI